MIDQGVKLQSIYLQSYLYITKTNARFFVETGVCLFIEFQFVQGGGWCFLCDICGESYEWLF